MPYSDLNATTTENLRITQNRYRTGIGNITELLRTETAQFDPRTRLMAALTADSAVGNERSN